MPRITRIHFAGLGHQDARFPALTLDLRDPAGRAGDSVIWAENGTGKSSLLSLFFSTYRPNQRLFLGKQAESKARELGDYLRDRDLGFIITEWDTTDDRAEASLLSDGPRELLLVGQALSWRNLDRSTGDLRRLFFTLRPGRDVHFESLPVLGLAAPATSFEAFREWLDAQQKSHPRLDIVHTTNHTEWRDHLEKNHLDPELFTFQLRMNEREGGINNLFNELKRDADFIHEFLKLGFDPATAAEVRANLDAFLPKLRRREALELQLEFNQKLLVDLGLFVQQVAVWEAAKQRGEQAEREAAALWAGLIAAQARFKSEAAQLQSRLQELDGERTRLESARTANGRRQNFFRRLKAQLEVREAEAEQKRCEQNRTQAQGDKRLVEMAMVLAELRTVTAEVTELERALERERTQAKPVLEALQTLGADYKFQLEQASAAVKASQSAVAQQRSNLAGVINNLRDDRTSLLTEQSTKQQEKNSLDAHFASRESHRDRLRNDGWLEAKEVATEALTRWQSRSTTAREAEQSAHRSLQNLRAEQTTLVEAATRLASDVTTATGKTGGSQLTLMAPTDSPATQSTGTITFNPGAVANGTSGVYGFNGTSAANPNMAGYRLAGLECEPGHQGRRPPSDPHRHRDGTRHRRLGQYFRLRGGGRRGCGAPRLRSGADPDLANLYATNATRLAGRARSRWDRSTRPRTSSAQLLRARVARRSVSQTEGGTAGDGSLGPIGQAPTGAVGIWRLVPAGQE